MRRIVEGRSSTSKRVVTNYMEGCLQHGRGGGCEVLSLRKGGGTEKVLAMLKGGGRKSFGVVFM